MRGTAFKRALPIAVSVLILGALWWRIDLTAIVAGTSELEYRHFALYAYAGALFWVTVFLSLGYVVGDKWQQVYGRIHHHAHIAGAVLTVAALAYWAWWRFQKRKQPRP